MGDGVPVLPRPTRIEFEFPGIKVAARRSGSSERGAGLGLGAWNRRMPRAPAAGDGRAENKWFGSRYSHQLSRRAAGERRGEGEGSEKGRGGAWLRVPCACVQRRRASPGALLSAGSAPAGRLLLPWPPPRLAAGAKAHPRRAGRSRVLAGRSPLATSGAPGTRTRRAPNVQRLSHPALHARAGLPCPARLSVRPPSDTSSGQASRLQPTFLSPEPPPPLKSAINFPLLPPPRSAPAVQTPPPAAPSLTSRLARPPPARPPALGASPPLRPPGPPSSRPGPARTPRERRRAPPGAQGMNISVLAKLPSADVMAPAAVATPRMPQRGREEARRSGPRCETEPCPTWPPAVPQRSAQADGGP